MKVKFIIPAVLLAVAACSTKEKPADAFGNFEALEYTVSAESNGRVISQLTDEGRVVAKDSTLAIIDTLDLSLRGDQLASQHTAVIGRATPLEAQKMVYNQQIDNYNRDRERFMRMLKDGAATQKQLDDIEGAIKLAERQIGAVDAQFSSLHSEAAAISSQIEQVKEAVRRCVIKSPIDGTVIESYVRKGEFVNVGKALFKIADLKSLDLKVFVTGDQLASIKLGQQVRVYVDGFESGRELSGTVTWISSEAEFTPKTIQTRKERVNLVYAVKVRVANDGSLKIGMPGEVRL
ncbi:MAG: efflux RND transporter periplasmic adaptor subunit [Bacteroidales bacterium]|nr:efflux RND transporter periplasmic adaptor subunit [Bacteroidales bacterium]MDD3663801.1 efflux RND transporter periplasmic adaptor subunit [Bacteroidales bacterium]